MTYDEALEVTTFVINGWPDQRDWTTDQITMYAKGIERFDAETATKAVLRAQTTMPRRPTVADMFALCRAVSADNPPPTSYTYPDGIPVHNNPKSMPVWVKRWICARYLYASFDREQDMRVFPEQRDWSGPESPTMPPGEWKQEAQALSKAKAWNVFRAGAIA